MNICVFDTETIGLTSLFCYNVGYQIINTETHEIKLKRDYVIKEIFFDRFLFETAYYKEKRPLYIAGITENKIKVKTFNNLIKSMQKDFIKFEIKNAYAYNADFDKRVFEYNCSFFETENPFQDIAIFDIMQYAKKFLTNSTEYSNFCLENNFLTKTQMYLSTTAEIVFSFISKNLDFQEKHFALADVEIETEILLHCIKYLDAVFNTEYYGNIPRVPKSLQNIYNIFIDSEQINDIKLSLSTKRNNNFYFKT